MNYFKRKLYDYHVMKAQTILASPGGPSPIAQKLVAYHERKALELTKS